MYHRLTKSQQCINCFEAVDTQETLYELLFKEDCLCVKCRSKLEKNHKTIEIEGVKVKALYIYNDQASRWMMQIKEAHDITMAKVFVYPYIYKLRRQFKNKTVIMVPSSQRKTKERKYHALKEMFACLRIDIVDAFEKDDIKQSQGGKKDRTEISKHIRLRDESINYGPIVLIDDICTTGETLKACIQLLKAHSSSIDCMVCCIHPYWLNKDNLI